MKIIPRSSISKKNKMDTHNHDNLLQFTLLGKKYALKINSVIQILQTLTITPIANSTRYITGSTTFQGEVVPVIDLQSFLYGEIPNNAKKASNEYSDYLVVEHRGKKVVFQVGSVLGSIKRPKEAFISDLLHLVNSTENLYFKKAFIDTYEQIIVQIDLEQVLDRIIYELKQTQKQFIEENMAMLIPIEVPKDSKEFNIDLKQKVFATPQTITKSSGRKPIRSSRKVTSTATQVSVHNLDILIPNDHILEIFNINNITLVPNAPRAVLGTMNFRGDIISVLDLAEILRPTPIDKERAGEAPIVGAQVLILEIKDQKMALFVDKISDIYNMDDADIRSTLNFTENSDSTHLFQSVMLGRSGEINMVLDIEYLANIVSNPIILEQESDPVVFFENPIEKSLYQVSDSLMDGLLFENEGSYFFIDSDFISQIIDENSFILKEFSHDAIRGAAIHANIVPVIDFSTILKESKNKTNPSPKSVGILVNDPKNDLEVVFLVDNVLNRLSVNKFDTYQTEVGVSEKALSPLISGFFSYQGTLGMIMNPLNLLEETSTVLQNILQLKNIKEEFSSLLSSDEVQYLESVKDRRKGLELLLFYRHKGIRFDYFIFECREHLLSIDIVFIRKVFASLQYENIDSEFHPLTGIATIDGDKLPLLDLAGLLFSSEVQADFQQSTNFFTIECQTQTFIIPTSNIKGVETKFKEELIPCEDTSFFLEGKKACLHTFSLENVSNPIHIIEKDLLTKILTEKNLKSLLKKLKKEIIEKD